MIANLASKPTNAPTFRTGDERLVKLTPSAASKVSTLLTKQGRPAGVLRVAVVGGGCSGLQYKMDLQDAPASRDILVESSGIKAVIQGERIFHNRPEVSVQYPTVSTARPVNALLPSPPG